MSAHDQRRSTGGGDAGDEIERIAGDMRRLRDPGDDCVPDVAGEPGDLSEAHVLVRHGGAGPRLGVAELRPEGVRVEAGQLFGGAGELVGRVREEVGAVAESGAVARGLGEGEAAEVSCGPAGGGVGGGGGGKREVGGGGRGAGGERADADGGVACLGAGGGDEGGWWCVG